MKRYLVFLVTLMCSIAIFAQDHQKFDPVKFQADLEQYVIKEAGITQAEQAKFLPIFREMRKKQVALMESARKSMGKKPTTEADWAAAIKRHDDHEIQMKKLAQTYHNQLLKVIPASKLMKVIRAEETFHRQQFRQYSGNGQGRGNGQNGGRPQRR